MSEKDKQARKIAMIVELVDLIGDDVTSAEIVSALRMYQKKREAERERRHRNYVPRGNPVGRPRKEPAIFTGDIK